MIITAVGARKTPAHILAEMEEFGELAATRGWWLRSGHAAGADYAFEQGAKERCIVYLPWDTFMAREHQMLGLPVHLGEGVDMLTCLRAVTAISPYIANCSQSVKLLHARNAMQVLGKNLDRPSDALVCWTPDGKTIGGTATAIKLAEQHNIPCFNMALDKLSTADKLIPAIEAWVYHHQVNTP